MRIRSTLRDDVKPHDSEGNAGKQGFKSKRVMPSREPEEGCEAPKTSAARIMPLPRKEGGRYSNAAAEPGSYRLTSSKLAVKHNV